MVREKADMVPEKAAASVEDFVNTGQIDDLKNFGATLSQSQVLDKSQENLPIILKQADGLRLKRIAIADRCQVSVATVSRWANGLVTPHFFIAKAAILAVRDLAVEKALEYQREIKKRESKKQNVSI